MKSESSRAREAGFATLPGRHYLGGMTDRPKRPRDPNQLAKFIVDLATEGDSSVPLPDHEGQRKGGLKGGKARAASMTPIQREDMARLAAQARWKKD